MSIGKNIKQIRKENNLTQKQMAKIAGVTDKAVSMWEMEKREPRMGAIQKIADYLGVAKSKIIDEPPFGVSINEHFEMPAFEHQSIQSVYSNLYNTALKETIPPSEYFYIKQSGDSMAPFILNEDILLIQKSNNAKSGLYAAVAVDGGEASIYKIITHVNGLELLSENPYYPKQSFEGNQKNRVCVLGILKQIIRNL